MSAAADQPPIKKRRLPLGAPRSKPRGPAARPGGTRPLPPPPPAPQRRAGRVGVARARPAPSPAPSPLGSRRQRGPRTSGVRPAPGSAAGPPSPTPLVLREEILPPFPVPREGKLWERPRLAVREAPFMQQVIDLFRISGWGAYHTYDSRRSAAGFPDLAFCYPPHGGYTGVQLVVETKTEKGKPTPEQDHWLALYRGAGVLVRVWRPRDFDEIVRVARAPVVEPAWLAALVEEARRAAPAVTVPPLVSRAKKRRRKREGGGA